jgi:hypothetical protein
MGYNAPVFDGPHPENLGFRSGPKGTHTSRTMMVDELSALFEAVPPGAHRATYVTAIVEDNILSKQTIATRKLSAQRLSELYTLDFKAPLFRILRRFWTQDLQGRPLLALLCVLGRDPILRATAQPVLSLRPNEELSRQSMTNALRDHVGNRLNDATLDKAVRNTAASWTQSGHLMGRVRKFRRLVRPTASTTAYALVIGYLQGFRGARLFDTLWTKVLDADQAELRQRAAEAKRLGHLDLKVAGDIVEVGFSTLLTPQEIRDSRVTT